MNQQQLGLESAAKLIASSANAILRCATERSIPRYVEHWRYPSDLHTAFEQCEQEYRQFVMKELDIIMKGKSL